jgi:hypothetical protein
VAAVKYSVAPERVWEASVVKKAACHFLDCVVDSFGYSVLRWCVHIGLFMMDSLLNEVCLKFRGVIFASAISMDKVDLFSSNDFSLSDVGLECVKRFIFGFLYSSYLITLSVLALVSHSQLR